jgi:hypothetical protein
MVPLGEDGDCGWVVQDVITKARVRASAALAITPLRVRTSVTIFIVSSSGATRTVF